MQASRSVLRALMAKLEGKGCAPLPVCFYTTFAVMSLTAPYIPPKKKEFEVKEQTNIEHERKCVCFGCSRVGQPSSVKHTTRLDPDNAKLNNSTTGARKKETLRQNTK